MKKINYHTTKTLPKTPRLLNMIYEGKSQYMTKIKSPVDVHTLINNVMQELDGQREHCFCISMNTKNQIKSVDVISIGTLNANIVHPREIFYTAICHRAASVIISHNHPSGDPTPSKEDIEVTEKLIEGGKLIGIDVLDHVIIGDTRYISLKDEGLVV
jgi:DNA repair protein RadC